MKIENASVYDTRALRRIVCGVHADLARREGRRLPQWSRLRVRGPFDWTAAEPRAPADETVPLAAVRVKPRRDVRGERYAKVLERERLWQRRLKLAATKLKKVRQQRWYYERAATPRTTVSSAPHREGDVLDSPMTSKRRDP